MNILVLNGSPRPHGNTSALVDTFTEEAQKASHQVFVLSDWEQGYSWLQKL